MNLYLVTLHGQLRYAGVSIPEAKTVLKDAWPTAEVFRIEMTDITQEAHNPAKGTP